MFSGDYTKGQVQKDCGGGGLVAYLGTNDGKEIVRRIQDGDLCRLIYEAMAYQIAGIAPGPPCLRAMLMR